MLATDRPLFHGISDSALKVARARLAAKHAELKPRAMDMDRRAAQLCASLCVVAAEIDLELRERRDRPAPSMSDAVFLATAETFAAWARETGRARA